MNERTPLIQTVIITRTEPRYPHSTLRRFFTTCLGCLLFIITIVFMVSVAIIPLKHYHNHLHGHSAAGAASTPNKQELGLSELQSIFLSTPDEKRAREWSQYYSSGPHLAGKNLSQALWTRQKWQEFGISADLATYDVYINYPVDHRLALLNDGKVAYECSLEEDVLEEDPTTAVEERIPTFHGYSASGNVTAPYVYVNYGTWWDFEDLIKANISLKGKIALAKYGRNFRGVKTQRAQELGMVGIVMYSDPQDDGNTTEANGYKPYPHGPARQPSSVQRGSTQFLSTMPGDPTTPGYPSKPGVPRADPHGSTPQIPSLPISYQDAIPLLKALNGHGPTSDSLGQWWEGGGLTYKGVNYNIGPSPDSLALNLYNEQEYVTTPIWDVIGIINGTLADEVILIGNHRDAWIAGGAGDPHAGSAALMEVVRSFGVALAEGWKPHRTIIFASWDGEEYGLLGSTEWVEEFLPWLSDKAVTYVNVDLGTKGTKFAVSANSLLKSLIYNVTSLVPSPKGGSVRDHWDGYISPLGSGSDYTAFQDYAGIPSIDLHFVEEEGDPVYHYHSNYDSFHWMDTYGDPTWEYHTTIAKIMALLVGNLAETPVLPLNATDYATALTGYLATVKTAASKTRFAHAFSFASLDDATLRLYRASLAFDNYTSDLSIQINITYPWYLFWKKLLVLYHIGTANKVYKLLDRQFLNPAGLDNRPWFKHIVFAPGRWTGYAGAVYPGLLESFEDGKLANAYKWRRIIEEKLNMAAASLEKAL